MNRYNVLHSSIHQEESTVPNLVDVLVDEVLAVTARAILVVIEDEEHWLPKSQIEDAEEFTAGQVEVMVAMPQWLAKERGFTWEQA
jgi:hypothetical protein